MCFPKRYYKSILYTCPCNLTNSLNPPKIIRGYAKKDLDTLMFPDCRIGFHYYKRFFGADIIEREVYCSLCHLYERNKDQWNDNHYDYNKY